MKIILIFLTYLLQGVASTKMKVTGETGKSITITCSLDDTSDAVKYFCKGNCKSDDDVLIKSSWNWNSKKYHLKDYKKNFKVTISHLTMGDSGTYWCGWERYILWDFYKEVVLSVKQALPTRQETKKAQSTTTNPPLQRIPNTSSKMPIYIGASLGVIILALALVLLIYFRQKKGNVSTYSGREKEKPLNCATSLKKKIKSDGEHISTAVESHDTRRNSNSPNSPNNLLYATVTHKHFKSNTVSREPTDIAYSTIKFTDESAVYCNV
ncbi:uncharacterized protein LOC144076981 [Stigmatopora argus]